jgi:hypothetical protein
VIVFRRDGSGHLRGPRRPIEGEAIRLGAHLSSNRMADAVAQALECFVSSRSLTPCSYLARAQGDRFSFVMNSRRFDFDRRLHSPALTFADAVRDDAMALVARVDSPETHRKTLSGRPRPPVLRPSSGRSSSGSELDPVVTTAQLAIQWASRFRPATTCAAGPRPPRLPGRPAPLQDQRDRRLARAVEADNAERHTRTVG